MLDGTMGAVGDTLTGIVQGTRLLTNRGACRVEHLAPGDALVAAGGTEVEVVSVDTQVRRATGDDAPVRIHAGALGNHVDLWLAPDHPVVSHAALIPARALVDDFLAEVAYGGMVTYVRVKLSQDAVIQADGAEVGCSAGLDMPDIARRSAANAPALRPV